MEQYMEIKDDRVTDMEYGEHFAILLHCGENPSVNITVDFEGMPVKTLIKLAFDTMKVKFRPHVKPLSVEELKNTFDGKTITWREMTTKDGAGSKIELATKTPAEIALEIKRLQESLKNVQTTSKNGNNS